MIAEGHTNWQSIAAAVDLANPAVGSGNSDSCRRTMWCNFGVLFTQRFPSLDLNSPRRDRGLHIIRRLRNGFDWYTDCTQCPFCRCRTPFLAQHWSTQASGGGCPDKSVQAMQRDMWESLERLVVSDSVQQLVKRAKQSAAKWPCAEDIAWCAPRNLATRLLLGGHLWPDERPGPGWVPTDIDRAYGDIAKDAASAQQRVHAMLQCSADRLLIQSVCENWLRCIHDLRSRFQTPKAFWRRAQLAAPTCRMSRPQRKQLRLHFARRVPQYAAQIYAAQREHDMFAHECEVPAPTRATCGMLAIVDQGSRFTVMVSCTTVREGRVASG